MELPHLGKHCSHPDCNQLDFLPVKCNLCDKIYCHSHLKYEAHLCPLSYKLDVHIPICPLCDQPVPSKPGEQPDLAVNDHLENNCISKSKKIYKNKCSVTGCKQREVVSIECSVCSLNFCLKHRHTADHDCKGENVTRRERTLNGSIFKNFLKMSGGQASSTSQTTAKVSTSDNNVINVQTSKAPRVVTVSTLQGNISEKEALDRAILASKQGTHSTLPSVSSSEDEDLARAIAASLEDSNKSNSSRTRLRHGTSDCTLS